MSAPVLDQVRAVLAAQLGLQPDQVPPDAKWEALKLNGCGRLETLDSLDRLELAMAVEDRFGIEISDDEVFRLTGVADTAALVARRLAEQADA